MKTLTLEECLQNDYTEDELRYWSRFYGIRIGRSKPSTLAQKIAEKLLDEAEMHERLIILHDDEISLLERCIRDGVHPVREGESETARRLIQTDYVYMTQEGLTVPADVSDAYRKLNTLSFQKYRTLVSYLLDCLKLVESVYLVIPYHEFRKLFTGKYSVLAKDEVFSQCWDMINPEDNPCTRNNDMIIANAAAELVPSILEERGSRPYSLPDPDEVKDWAGNGYPSGDPECIYFLEWMKDSGLEPGYAEDVLRNLVEMIAHDTEFETVLETLKSSMDINEPRFLPAEIRLKALSSSIRSSVLAGASEAQEEADRLRKDGMKGNNDVLYAKTVQEAAKLIEKRPVLQRLGYDVQVEKYAEEVLVAFQRPKKKKTFMKVLVFPNDPCPCGSGNTYRECHGRKRS